MKIIGITGGVGAGKTQILEYLNNKYGATIWNSRILVSSCTGKKKTKKYKVVYVDIYIQQQICGKLLLYICIL